MDAGILKREYVITLQSLYPRVATMATFIADLDSLENRRIAIAAANEVAPDLIESIKREVRWIFDRKRILKEL